MLGPLGPHQHDASKCRLGLGSSTVDVDVSINSNTLSGQTFDRCLTGFDSTCQKFGQVQAYIYIYFFFSLSY